MSNITSPRLSTRTKIRAAHILYRVIHMLRRLLGRGDTTEVTRRDVRWTLDLREGIDLAIYLFGYFEYETVRAYRRILRPGNTVVDIGANIGAHTLHMARCVSPDGRVIAFEPTAYAYNKLRHHVALNPSLANIIQTEQMMLVDSDETRLEPKLYSSWQIHDSVAGTHPKHGGRLMDTTGAGSISLDSYLAENTLGAVSLIKMDVDGHECQVLRGAQQLLRRDKPILLMELMPYGLEEAGASLDELLDILSANGYALYDLDGQTPLPDNRRILEEIPPAGGINILCYTK